MYMGEKAEVFYDAKDVFLYRNTKTRFNETNDSTKQLI